MSWEESARRENFEKKYIKVKTDIVAMRDNHAKVISEKDDQINKLKDEVGADKLLLQSNRKKMSGLKSEVEQWKRDYTKLETEFNNLKILHKKSTDDAYSENALSYSLGYGKLKDELLKDFPDLDLSAYNPPEVADDPMDEDAGEEEEDGEDEENEEEGQFHENVGVEGGDQPATDADRQEEEEEVEID